MGAAAYAADLDWRQHVARLAWRARAAPRHRRSVTANSISAGLCTPATVREAGGSGWRTDYPGADINFSIRFAELTKTAVSKDHDGEPEYFVVRSSDDDALFACPFIHMEDPGTADSSDADVQQLQGYLLKGGFMWSDDFWGSRAWDSWQHENGRLLPPSYPIVDIPVTHPMFQTVYNVKRILQVPAINQWRRAAAERPNAADSAV